MKRYFIALSLLAIPAAVAAMIRAPAPEAPEAPRPPDADAPAEAAEPPPQQLAEAGPVPRVQIALLLDNSGSMSGLINQARSELWTIVNELAEAKHGGRTPRVEVALYSYGDPPARQLVPFTTDLDAVSEALFNLQIAGGSEFCGQAIGIATDQLAWSDDPDDLKLLYIAGNEPFTQGPVAYADAIKKARDKDVLVSTIHCGAESIGLGSGWADAAQLGGGSAANIDHNQRVAHIATPFDKDIARLGVELNGTYLPYGASGKLGAMRQEAQDKNAFGLSLQVSTKRAVSKSSAHYSNSTWDLVDAFNEKKVKLEDLKTEALPESLRDLDVDERRAAVEKMTKERSALKKRIAELNNKREAFVAAERKKESGAGAETLDDALLGTLRSSAKAKGFELGG
jgi:hypothetical protein